MKKYLFLLILPIIFITGCNDEKSNGDIKELNDNIKVITCTKVQKEEFMDKDHVFKISFMNDILKSANYVTKITVNEEYLKEHTIESISKSLNDETSKEGLIVDTKARGNIISIVMDMDLEKLDDKTKAKYNLNISDYKKLKSTYERNGYSCE